MEEQENIWMDGRMGERIMYVWIDGQINGRMESQMREWMDGYIDGCWIGICEGVDKHIDE